MPNFLLNTQDLGPRFAAMSISQESQAQAR